MILIGAAWYAIVMVQTFMSYGTAYRKTKRGGDDGITLFGWLIAMGLAAMIPGLGIYLWKKERRKEAGYY